MFFQDWFLQVFHGEFDSTYCCLDHVFTQRHGVDRGASRICRCDHVTSILAHFNGMESGRQSCRYLFMQKADACWHPRVSDTTVGISTAVTSLRNLLDCRRFFAMEGDSDAHVVSNGWAVCHVWTLSSGQDFNDFPPSFCLSPSDCWDLLWHCWRPSTESRFVEKG